MAEENNSNNSESVQNLNTNSLTESNNSQENAELSNLNTEKQQETKSEPELPIPTTEKEEDQKKDIPKWVDKRISKKDREIAQEKQRADLLAQELERLKSLPPSQSINQQIDPNLDPYAPKRTDFPNDESFIDARFNYNQNKSLNIQQQRAHQESINKAQEEFSKKLTETMDEGDEKYDDFKEKTDKLFQPSFPGNRAMCEAILDSPYKADIFYFLGKYSDKAEEIAKMNPVKAVKKIAELEARFLERDKPDISKASKPIDPVNSNKGSSPAQTLDDLDRIAKKGNLKEFEEAFKKIKRKF